jgi:hypothetical protein
LGLLGKINQEPTGLLAAAVAFAVCALISVWGWGVLALPTRLIQGGVVDRLLRIQYCGYLPEPIAGRPPSPEMYVCSLKVAAQFVAGPLLIMLLGFLLVTVGRQPLARLIERLPAQVRFLAVPILTTVLFGMVWSGLHRDITNEAGLVPQRLFPALVGLFAFAAGRFTPLLQRHLAPFFALRDLCPLWLRVLLVFGLPMLLSLVITFEYRVTEEVKKEQIVALVALVAGYLAVTPARGDVASGVRQLLTGARAAR